MNLHILNKTPQYTDLLQRMLNASSVGDLIILIEDGVYHGLDAHFPRLEAHSKELKVFALENDIAARGLNDKMSISIDIVSYQQFVQLSAKADKTVSWF